MGFLFGATLSRRTAARESVRWLARARDQLQALLWPGACAACAEPCTQGAFCSACAATLDPVLQACPGCAMPAERDGARCGVCLARPPARASAHAAYRYGAAMARAIVEMKHGKRRDLARTLAPLMVPVLAVAAAAAALERELLLAPVPLHPARLRWRGFNQALELLLGARRALAAGGGWGSALARQLPVERELLARIRNTPDLGHAGPAERRRRIEGAFVVRDPRRVAGRAVLLVDDVLTTGSTTEECARMLLRAGAAEVHVVALARA